MHPLEVPTDIREVIRTNDLFALQLALSRDRKRGKELGQYGITPLHRANSLAAINMLLSSGANPNAIDNDGFTPLHAAVQRNQYDIVVRLLKAGAKVDTAIIYAKKREMAELLLSHKTSINNASLLNDALHSAVATGRIDVTELLLEYGVNINSININGKTPLHQAAYYKRLDIVRLLINKAMSPLNIENHPAPH